VNSEKELAALECQIHVSLNPKGVKDGVRKYKASDLKG
jgi:hypothetical protein